MQVELIKNLPSVPVEPIYIEKPITKIVEVEKIIERPIVTEIVKVVDRPIIIEKEKIVYREQIIETPVEKIIIKSGNAEGLLVGGNLSLIFALQASHSDIDTNGKILFLEDLDEYLYHIDRMMMALLHSRCALESKLYASIDNDENDNDEKIL